MTGLVRLVVALLGAAVLLVMDAGPAAAHAGGLSPQDYRSAVAGIWPELPGVSAAMVNNDTQLELRNDGPADLVVPADSTEKQEQSVAAGGVLRVADARTAWSDAPVADGAAGRITWRVPLRAESGGEPVDAVVFGWMEWRPGPSPLPWLAVTLAAALVVAAMGRWGAGVGMAAGVVVAAGSNVGHAVGSALAVSGQSFVPLVLGASDLSLAAWPLSLVAVLVALRRRPSAAFLAVLVGLMLVLAGAADLSSFWYSQLPFDGPAYLDRGLVALTFGGGLGLVVAGLGGMRRSMSAGSSALTSSSVEVAS